MPRIDPRRPPPPNELIELNAQIQQLHDPEEISARDSFQKMRQRRWVIVLMSWGAAVLAYYLAPIVVNTKNWPAITGLILAIAWIVGHVVAAVGVMCLISYLCVGRRMFEDMDM